MHARFALCGFLLAFMTACASMGLATPQSLDQRIAYAAGQVTAARGTAADALAGKTISVQDAESALRITDESKTFVDASRAALSAGDTQGAEARLALATSVLLAVKTYLEKKP